MHDLIGMFLNKLSLTFGANEPVTFASDWVGVKEELAGTVATAVFNNDSPFDGWMGKIEYGTSLGASLTEIPLVQSVTWSFDNKLEPLKGIGSRYMVGRKLGIPDILLDFTKLLQNNTTLYAYFTGNTQNALKLTLTHDALAGSSSGVYSVVIEMPKVVWLGDASALNSMEAIEEPYKTQALYDSVYGFSVRVTVVNSEAGVYTVTA